MFKHNQNGFSVLELTQFGMIIILVGVIGYMFYKHYPNTPKSVPKLEIVYRVKKVIESPSPAKSITIDYNDYGFSPNIINVPLGTIIYVKNLATDGSMVFQELPNQPLNSELDLGTIQMNQEKSFTAQIKGSWQFYNADETTDRGILTVS